MPPPNLARHDRLADAAIGLIAREGARGLTHRAVDAEAGEPPGTTSRYFRSRHALLGAAADRILAQHLADLELFLESTRRPDLQTRMSAARRAQISLVRQIHHAAGVELTDADATMLVSGVTGLLVMALTTPEVLGLRHPDDLRELVRQIAAGSFQVRRPAEFLPGPQVGTQ